MRSSRRTRHGMFTRGAAFCALALASSCSDHAHDAEDPSLAGDEAQGLGGASVSAKVQVPASMRTSPFDVDRFLKVPPGFAVSVYARLGGARFMAVAPGGDLFVSQPGSGKISRVRANGAADPVVSDFVTGLRRPHDMVFHAIGATTYLYVSETNQIDRYVYTAGDTTAKGRQVVVTGLPDASTSELHGAYGHELKNIALDANHKLYVSIASTCNACVADTTSTPVRGAIYQYDADGANGRLFARGLRNAEGLAFLPGTSELWAAVNNRDNIQYPLQDATGNYKKVIPSYVDNHPPEELTRVRDGGNYGWPFCNPNPDGAGGKDGMPFDLDVEFNADGHVNCGAMDRIDKGIQAHSAPLGLLFLQDTKFAADYRSGAVVGLHGSWNRTAKTGYKIAYFARDPATGKLGAQIDLVTGWLDDASQSAFGRPVDLAVDDAGALLVSDDASGTIYKISGAPAQAQAVTGATLINADTDRPVAGFDPIPDNATIDMAAIGTRNLNIRASTSPTTVGSVKFGFDANASYHVENVVPYCIGGDTGGNFDAWTPPLGTHRLTLTPYSAARLGGTAGKALTVHFTVR